MKKILLALVIAASFTACNGDKSTSTETTIDSTKTTTGDTTINKPDTSNTMAPLPSDTTLKVDTTKKKTTTTTTVKTDSAK